MTTARRSLLAAATGLAAGPFLSRSGLAQRGSSAVLRFVPSTPLPSLDPITATSYIIRNHGYLVYDTLFATDETFAIRPQMVSAWQTAPGGLKWTFHLRDGLRFHDGQPVGARDCIASIQRWSRRDAFGQTFAAFVEAYAADDARTFSIRLKQPFPLLPNALGKLSSNVPFIMPERVAAADAFRPITDPTGSGPWQFERGQWVPGQNAIYTRFAGYRPREEVPSWAAGGKVAKIDRIEWLGATEPAAAVGAMLQGEVDWFEQPPIDLVPLLRKGGMTIRNVPLGRALLLRFNHVQPPFDNVAVRRAVMMAMNQDDYMQAVVGSPDYYREAKTFFTPGTPMSSGAGGAAAMQADLSRAKSMLRDAGYKGERVVLLAPADQPIAYNQSLVTQQLLQQLGMSVDMVTSDWGTFIGRRANRGTVDAGGWSAFHTLWSGADVLTPALNPLIRANGADAFFGWPEDPELEALRSRWIATADLAEQKTLAAQIERRAFQVVPYAPAGQVEQPMAISPKLKNVIDSPVQFFWNAEK